MHREHEPRQQLIPYPINLVVAETDALNIGYSTKLDLLFQLQLVLAMLFCDCLRAKNYI